MSKGKLVLETGEVFSGETGGGIRDVCGEVVFNTGMTGYPESLTDPSYKGQILVFTYPLIGNYGVPRPRYSGDLLINFESGQIQPLGVVMGEIADCYSHWDSHCSLRQWLESGRVPALFGVDTRQLTQIIRDRGSVTGHMVFKTGAKNVPGPGDNLENPLAAVVSIDSPKEYPRGKSTVVLVDCGVKHSIIHHLLKRDITVIRVPWNYNFTEIDADGYLISNGPGDPAFCTQVIENTRRALAGKKPLLGICLGSQILALAAGARTYKLKYGHRGHNQPCLETGTSRCYITSQNHGYAVDAASLPEDWREWFYNLNDGTNEGIMHVSKPFFGTQFHPEAAPGPQDTEFLFDMFNRAMQ